MKRRLFGTMVLGGILALSLGCGGGGANGGGGGGGGTVPYTLFSLTVPVLLSVNSSANAVDPTGSQQGGVRFTNTTDSRALIWTGVNTSMVDLGPGAIRAIGGGVQIGFQGLEGAASERAYLWRGTEASGTSLHPAGYTTSHAVGGGADIQVGRGRIADSTSHALLWRGTAASVVDLHPAGYTNSRAYGGSGDVQVGTGEQGGVARALLWRGTAASVVDLGPGVAWAVSGDMQVGQGTSGGFAHALLWRGTAASRVDLHPAGFNDSRAFGVANGRQVGYASKADGTVHAILWEGTAASAIDLHSLTSTYLINGATPKHSFAMGIDNQGNVVGWVRTEAGQDHAVIWKRN